MALLVTMPHCETTLDSITLRASHRASVGEKKDMLKKVLSSLLTCLLLFFGCVPAEAKSGPDAQARFAAKVKEGIRSLGTGEAAEC